MKTRFAAGDRALYIQSIKDANEGKLKVPNISGIKILSGSEFKGTKKYDEDYSSYDMLQITIDGVDPKAKWNFAFAVAPMHYYTTRELSKLAMEDTTYSTNFGTDPSDENFMAKVKERNAVPMGAAFTRPLT